MNTLILAHDTRIAERNVGQGSRRELSSAGPESRRVKLLGVALAAIMSASMTLPVVGMAEGAGEGCDSVLQVHPGDNLAQVAAVHVARATNYCVTSSADGPTTRGPSTAGKHVAFSAKRAG